MERNEAQQLLEAERERLESARTVLEAEQGVTVDGKRVPETLDATPQDPAEVGDLFSDRQEVLDELTVLDHDLAEVQAALERLAAGTYGLCVDCGKPIGEERLRALPAVRRCVEDQRRREGGGAGPMTRPTGPSVRGN